MGIRFRIHSQLCGTFSEMGDELDIDVKSDSRQTMRDRLLSMFMLVGALSPWLLVIYFKSH